MGVRRDFLKRAPPVFPPSPPGRNQRTDALIGPVDTVRESPLTSRMR